MNNQHFELTTPIDAIVFDCDGTLSSIEGIDEIAKQNGVGELVSALTESAMAKTGLTPELYQQRLNLIKPTASQVNALGQHYFLHQTPHAAEVIRLLQQAGKAIYIASAGLYPAVADFGTRLGIPKEHIFAVDIYFDTHENYKGYDHASPFINNQGKREVVAKIKEQHPRILFVGDGMNDVSVKPLVVGFIGYGGTNYRENIAALSDVYISTPSLKSLLNLCLTREEQTQYIRQADTQ